MLEKNIESLTAILAWLCSYISMIFSTKYSKRPAKSDLGSQEVVIKHYTKLKDSLQEDVVILFGDGVYPFNLKMPNPYYEYYLYLCVF